MKLSHLFIVVCILSLSTSCVSLKPITFEAVENVAVEKISLKPSIDVDLKLNNPNTLGVRITDLDLKIDAFNSGLGDVSLSQPIHVPKENDFILPLTFKTSVSKAAKLLPNALGSVLGNKKVKMDFAGTITLKKWFFKKSFPFQFSEEVDPKKIKTK